MAAGKYDDIIDLSPPDPPHRSRMTMVNRGAQFSPFAALVGYDAVIRETARQTDSDIELEDSGKEMLDWKLRELAEYPERTVTILCFIADGKKEGGNYVPFTGRIKKMDLYTRIIYMEDGSQIPIDKIRGIDCVEE